MDLDLVLRMEQLISLTETNTIEYKAIHEKSKRTNRIGLIVIMDTIPETFSGDKEIKDLKQFLLEMDMHFGKSDRGGNKHAFCIT